MFSRLFSTLIPALALAATLGTSLQAQSLAVFGAAEWDENDLSLYLLGASVNPGRMGWQPYASIVGYTLRYPSQGTTLSKNVFSPSVGLMNRYDGGQYQFGVGYAFADEDFAAPVFVAEGADGDGVTASAQWNHWGKPRNASQIIAAYNFGSEFLWTRARHSFQLAQNGPLWAGVEGGILGGGDEGTKRWWAQFGPTLEYRFNPKFRIGASAGLKTGISNVSGTAAYGRLEFLLLPFQRN